MLCCAGTLERPAFARCDGNHQYAFCGWKLRPRRANLLAVTTMAGRLTLRSEIFTILHQGRVRQSHTGFPGCVRQMASMTNPHCLPISQLANLHPHIAETV